MLISIVSAARLVIGVGNRARHQANLAAVSGFV
jgi:hypothetical protein